MQVFPCLNDKKKHPHIKNCAGLIETVQHQELQLKLCIQALTKNTMPCILRPRLRARCISLWHFFQESFLRNQTTICANMPAQSKNFRNRSNRQGEKLPALTETATETWLDLIALKRCWRNSLTDGHAGQLQLPQRIKPQFPEHLLELICCTGIVLPRYYFLSNSIPSHTR